MTYRKIADHPGDFLEKSTLFGKPLTYWIMLGLLHEGRSLLDMAAFTFPDGKELYIRERD